MSLFGFATSYVTHNIKDFQNGVAKTIAAYDPEGASAAQRDDYGRKVHEAEGIAASAETKAQDAERVVADLIVKLDQHVAASGLLEKQIAELDAADPKKKGKQVALDKINKDSEQFLTELESAKLAVKETREFADAAKVAHDQLAEKWRTSQNRLEAAQRQQALARQEEERALSRRADAERLAGLTTGIDMDDVALSAMEANTRASRERAAGARMTTEALAPASTGDLEVAQALAAAAGGATAPKTTSASLSERLAALKAG